ncbi:hypothetical protein PENTCL1PPCAC_21443 [Pristionchus entomophagus]|uniref:F-box domain-containing protein n=1 Tax=Pristionchus entomophagus TaxID=358040 RepID=A0AAV5TXJ8_9BILA|nr:hypothetical protein PENTCL1PPCAC_21443 [Pristionchus entomophagus]
MNSIVFQTSRTLRSRVNGYGRQEATIKVVDSFKIIGNNSLRNGPTDMPEFLIFFFPMRKSKLFELRLSIRHLDILFQSRYRSGTSVEYNMQLSDPRQILLLSVCMGKQIGTVFLFKCSEHHDLIAASRALEGKTFRRMNVRIEKLSDDNANHLVETIKLHDVDHLMLSIRNSNISSQVEFLLELSLLLRALSLTQQSVTCIDFNTNYFLGVEEMDWAPIFVDMFSRKLDKLSIDNRYYQEYLLNGGVDLLRERLPMLDKKVWFKATCDLYIDEVSEKRNGHRVQIDRQLLAWANDGESCSLVIKHGSRCGEQFEG